MIHLFMMKKKLIVDYGDRIPDPKPSTNGDSTIYNHYSGKAHYYQQKVNSL